MRWGHPEDAVAIGLFLYATALADARPPGRRGWRERPWPCSRWCCSRSLFVARASSPGGYRLCRPSPAAAPGALLLAAAAAANWTPTVHAVTSQPNYPAIDIPPVVYLDLCPAPGRRRQAVAGPGHILAIAAALGLCALVVARRWRAARARRPGGGDPGR